MSRSLVYNLITDTESLSQIRKENLQLRDDFLDYLKSIDRATKTIDAYRHDLNIFFVYNLKHNDNKKFTEITKREFIRFQNHALNEWRWSPNRLNTVKSALSSLSNFIENILDEEQEYADYHSIIRKIASPTKSTVWEKTVLETEDVQNLLDYLVFSKKYMQAAIVALCASSGRRKSEIPRLKTSYFTPENVLFGSLYKTPEKIRTKGRGKQGKQINIYVIKKTFDPYLELWMKERESQGIFSEWLFPSTKDPSKPLNTDRMDDWAKTYKVFLGKDFYWHSLRHYFTTELVRHNVPTTVIQDIINWESSDMVKLYTDIAMDEHLEKYFDENGIKTVDTATPATLDTLQKPNLLIAM